MNTIKSVCYIAIFCIIASCSKNTNQVDNDVTGSVGFFNSNQNQYNISYSTADGHNYQLFNFQDLGSDTIQFSQVHTTPQDSTYGYVLNYDLTSINDISTIDSVGNNITVSLTDNSQFTFSSQRISGDLILTHITSGLKFNFGNVDLATINQQIILWGPIIRGGILLILIYVDNVCNDQIEAHERRLNAQGCLERLTGLCQVKCVCPFNHSNT